MFILHVTVAGHSLGLHISDDFGWLQSFAFGMLSAGAEVKYLTREEADRL